MGGVNAVQIKIVDSLYHAMLVGYFGMPASFFVFDGACTVSGRMPVGASLGC